MSLLTAFAAIRSRAETLWPGIEATVPLSFPNEITDTAGGALPSRDAEGDPAPFVVIDVRWNGGDFMSIGAPRDNLVRRDGLIWIFAFIPQGTGEARAHELVAECAEIFEGQDFLPVVCRAMSPGGDVDSENGLYYGQSASIPFYFDETA